MQHDRRASFLLAVLTTMALHGCTDRVIRFGSTEMHDTDAGQSSSDGDTTTTAGPLTSTTADSEGPTTPEDDGTSSGPDWPTTPEDDGTTMNDDSSSGGDPVVDPCERFVAVNNSDAQLCGLTHVTFEMEDTALSFGAQCQLAAAAACIAERPEQLYLEAHASPDEGQNVPGSGMEEAQYELSDQRGDAVRAFLVEAGVPPLRLSVISKGALDHQVQDRRVILIWDL